MSASRVKSHPKRPLELRLELATMAGFKCTHCKCTYKYRKNLQRHVKSKHSGVEIETNARRGGRSTGSRDVITVKPISHGVRTWIDMYEAYILRLQLLHVLYVAKSVHVPAILKCT